MIEASDKKEDEIIDNGDDSESDDQQDEGVLGSLANVGKNFASGLRGGKTVQQIGQGGKFGKIAPGGRTAQKTGAALANNPVKTALGATAAGAGAGLAFGGAAGAAAKPERQPGGASGAGGANKPPAQAGSMNPEQEELIKQIQATMGSLADVEDPTVVAGLQTAQAAISRFGDNKPQSAMDNATAAAAQSAALATPATASTAPKTATPTPTQPRVNPGA
jgi:hypothetical protein